MTSIAAHGANAIPLASRAAVRTDRSALAAQWMLRPHGVAVAVMVVSLRSLGSVGAGWSFEFAPVPLYGMGHHPHAAPFHADKAV